MKNKTVNQIKIQLEELAKIAPKPKVVFFKIEKGGYAEHDQFLNITVPTLRTIARHTEELDLDQLKILLYSKFNEERLLSLLLLTDQYSKLANKRTQIYQFYMENLNQVNNWNLVDASAHLILGAHLHSQSKDVLFELAKSPNMWERRIAIVATWYFIKNNEYKTTTKIAELLLNDNHDLIHKAVGWMLREVGKKDVETLRDFLNKFANKMPRTMLRYAIEKFPEAERRHYLKIG